MNTSTLTFDDKGLIPAIVIHHETGEVLMVAYMNTEALERTVSSGQVTFWSRSRQQLWVKGETSGQTLSLKSIRTDCDADVLLVAAEPRGPVCHEGYASCFFRELREGEWEKIAEPIISPEQLYGRKP